MTRREGSTETSRFNREQLWCRALLKCCGALLSLGSATAPRGGAGRLGAPTPARRGQAEGIAVV